MRKIHCLALLTALSLSGTAAFAEGPPERPFFLKGGIAHVGFSESATVSMGGSVVPGGDGRVKDNVSLSLEFGYYVTPDISVAVAAGLPPTTTVSGAGSLAAAGELGDVTYGPTVFSASYHFGEPGGIRPYLGAGISYTIIFDTKDRALSNLQAKNAWGTALVAGIDVPLNERWGAFIDVKKIWTKSTATFDAAGGGRDSAVLTLDPLVVSSGLSWRF